MQYAVYVKGYKVCHAGNDIFTRKLMLICISQHVPHVCLHAQYANSASCFYESIFYFSKGKELSCRRKS